MRAVPIIVAVVAPAAFASITVTSDDRSYYAFAQGQSNLGGDQNTAFQNATDSSDNPFDPWNAGDSVSSVGAQSAVASAFVAIASQVTTNSFTANGSAFGSATILDENGQNAEGTARCYMRVAFTVNAGSLWQITGSLGANGAGFATIALYEGGSIFGNQVFNYNGGIVDDTIYLEAGAYYLSMSAEVTANVFNQETVTGDAFYSGVFARVPSPASVIPLALLALASPRRRTV
jgi:hypothetical protein